jgi:hypothetical protein
MPRRNRNSGTLPPDNALLADQLADLAARLGICGPPARAGQPAPIPPASTAKAVTP